MTAITAVDLPRIMNIVMQLESFGRMGDAAQLRALLQERQTHVDVLSELVRVERLRQKVDAHFGVSRMHTAETRRMYADYTLSKPLAWQSAFDIVDAQAQNSEAPADSQSAGASNSPTA